MRPGGCSPWADLDEYFCEYVDGAMDAATHAAFEEVLAADPDARAHAEALRETRLLLGGCPCAAQAPRDLRHRLHDRLATEMTCGRGSAMHGARWIGAGVMLASVVVLGVLAVAVRPAEPAAPNSDAPRYQAPISARAVPTHTPRRAPWQTARQTSRQAPWESGRDAGRSAKPVRINAVPLPPALRYLDAATPDGVPSPSASPFGGTARLQNAGL